jgi:hypothetical protein
MIFITSSLEQRHALLEEHEVLHSNRGINRFTDILRENKE